MNSKDVGNLGEHIAIVELLKYGISVSRPLGDNDRYDLILDINGALYKAQVKSSNTYDGDTVEFHLKSSQAHRGKGKQAYKDIDIFILVDIKTKTSTCFMLTADEFEGRSTIKLRYTTPKSSNQHNINCAKNFLLSSCVETLHQIS